MAVTVEEFAAYVGENYDQSDRQAELEESLSAASAHLAIKAESFWREMPESLYDNCVKVVARNIYQNGENTGGNGQYEETATVRAPLDPTISIRAILKEYLLGV